jgi:hypothetical protein
VLEGEPTPVPLVIVEVVEVTDPTWAYAARASISEEATLKVKNFIAVQRGRRKCELPVVVLTEYFILKLAGKMTLKWHQPCRANVATSTAAK